MAQDHNNLIWIDMEMTGLIPTPTASSKSRWWSPTRNLNIVAESPALVVHQADAVLEAWTPGTRARTANPA